MNRPESISLAAGEEYCVVAAPFGRLGIRTEMVDTSLMVSKIAYLPSRTPMKPPSNGLAQELLRQLTAYFADPSYRFDIPLKPVGTVHQQKVWQSVQDIPLGQTWTYGEIARRIQSAPRAVGGACGANPYPLVVPCHRVVSASDIGGFMKETGPGFYRQIKVWLLEHEGVL